MSFFWSLAFLAAAPLVMAYPMGAPIQACVNLTPSHLNKTDQTVLIPPQAGPSPYALSVSKNMYTPSEELTVTVTSVTGDYFEGFLLQARLADDTLVGTFSDPPTNTTLLQCTGPGDSVTHTSSVHKEAGTSFTWTAPGSDVGNVTFTATFVLEYDEFWVKVTSQEIMAFTVIDECSVNDTSPSPCDYVNGACVNSSGSYSCSCNPGYELSNDDDSTCNDIDECSVNDPAPCDTENGACANSGGSYSCSCNPGYEVSNDDDSTCNDIDECSVNDPAPCDTENGACANSGGSYSCSCNAGYTLSTADGSKCNGAPWVTFNSALIISLLGVVFVATKQ